jgi:dimeric dUTPase (all-alpha-NTP-PPase superfamily)
MKISQQQIFSMLKLQDEMNSIVNPNWRNAGYNWSRAIMVEAVEAIEHHGWKWWKKQVPDMPQVQMELVDIWHFALSLLMQNTDAGNEPHLIKVTHEISTNKAILSYNDDLESLPPSMHEDGTLLDAMQTMVGRAASGGFDIHEFSHALKLSGMSWSDLYMSYIGKNCLNRFRQAHGYKTGEYIKDWSAMPLIQPLTEVRELEDNDHLHDILQQTDISRPDLFEVLTNELGLRYKFVGRCVVTA